MNERTISIAEANEAKAMLAKLSERDLARVLADSHHACDLAGRLRARLATAESIESYGRETYTLADGIEQQIRAYTRLVEEEVSRRKA